MPTASLRQNNSFTRTKMPFPSFARFSPITHAELILAQNRHSCLPCQFTFEIACCFCIALKKGLSVKGELLVVLNHLFSLQQEKNLNCRTEFRDWCLYHTNFPLDSSWEIGDPISSSVIRKKPLLNILSGNINFVSANIFMMPLGKRKTTLQIIMFSA